MEKIIFGTYHLKDDLLEKSLKLAYNSGITKYDTAKLYKNEDQVGKFFVNNIDTNKEIWITTKIFDKSLHPMDSILQHIQDSVNIIRVNKDQQPNLKIRLLLHHPMSNYIWKALELAKESGIVDDIGVSNHNIEALEHLLKYATIKPSVNQLEIHPFLPNGELQGLLDYCQEKGIPVEGHSILTKGINLGNKLLKGMAEEKNITPVQYCILWALKHPIVQSICITTTNQYHLNEILDIVNNPNPIRLNDHNDNHQFELLSSSIRLYPWKTAPKNSININSIVDICNQLRYDLTAFKSEDSEVKNSISDLAFILPSVKSKHTNFGRKVAKELFNNNDIPQLSIYQKFNDLFKPLRIYIHDRAREQEKLLHKETFGATCCVLKKSSLNKMQKRVNNDTPADTISDLIINPKPMPVEITSEESLRPFLTYLRENNYNSNDNINDKEDNNRSPLEFYRGAMYNGRMDMCKQVVGPTHIAKLCDAVQQNAHIKHFLLGNNIAFQDHPNLSQAIADIMLTNQPIETWYLAGNCIDAQAISIICKALEKNTVAKALWLKRNPIGPLGAIHLSNLLPINRTLSILDLTNCGLLDEGITTLAKSDNCHIKHIYLDANGITSKGAVAIAEWITRHKHILKTFYISINRIGDDGAKAITCAFKSSQSLKRLCLASNRLTNDSLQEIVDLSMSCSELICLDLGAYKSTYDLGEQPNYFTTAKPLYDLINKHPKLQFIDITVNEIVKEEILECIRLSKLNQNKPITIYGWQTNTDSKDKELYRLTGVLDKTQLKYIRHPKKVKNIYSIYRNKM